MNLFKYHSLYILCFLTSALAQYGTSPSSTSSASATVATSSVISVSVGASGLVFTPDTATAAMGDNIQFHITPGHSVTQSTFSDPCHPIAGVGVYSGFPTGSTPFTITVNNTDPIWLYCSQTAGGHCQAGMAMVINAPSNETIAMYKSAASTASSSTSPPSVQGGVFGNAVSSSSSAASAASSAAASPTQHGKAAPQIEIDNAVMMATLALGMYALTWM